MNCPKCKSALETKKHKDIEVDYCSKCKGMWLDFDELDQLEDHVLDDDDQKGTVIFSSFPTDYDCPHCNKKLKMFKYRLFDLELEYCEENHGFWLDENEEERVLDIMKREIANMERKYNAEDKWKKTVKKLRSKSFFSRFTGR